MMEAGKNSDADISSTENDHQPDKSNEDSTGVRRSYECNFCKCGFTNAQALGGHMNIHRKDKVKAKHKNQEEPSNRPNESYTNLRYSAQILSTDPRQQTSYNRGVGGQVNYQVHLPSNPSIQTGSYLPVWSSENFEGDVDANLNLRVGISSPTAEDGEGGDVDRKAKENEVVDLELRLGHDP